jgi:5-methylcytosine-specific restriction enzyme subunit McrC
MPQNTSITLFEHEFRSYSDFILGPSSHHLDLIEKLNESNGEILTLKRNGLRTKQYVGLIQVRDFSIEILPKMYSDGLTRASKIENSQRNLLYLLHYCYDIPIYESDIAHMQSRKAAWFEILTYIFTKNLIDVFKKGAQKQYIEVEENLPYFKGKWMVQKHIVSNCFKKHHFYVNYDEFSPDIPLNQILKFVVRRLKYQSQDSENRKNLHILDYQMEDITYVSNPTPLLNKVIFTRLNENYRPAFNMAKMFIDANVVETSVGSMSSFAFTFDMNVLFERFITRFLKKHRRSILPEDLLDCNLYSQMGRKELARNSKEEKSFWLIPDILFNRKAKTKLIIDTKYKKLRKKDRKKGVSVADMYQMAAYANRYDCSKIILLYPRTSGINGHIIEKYMLKPTGQQIKVATVDLRIDLTNPVNKKKLIEDIRKILEEE